ncbi:TetR/AcrR family transcriptional regulator [Kutzneria albida]|uniref:TetR/AcrR family transcriptional regulator n=1 Tax=Kutzneria albida TaxID=43357 RepID=UPI00046D41E9|nr:TetR/AcrR family transcriptional regulator [Kutzneria albida]
MVRQRGRPSTGVREAVLAATAEILRVDGIARLSTKEVARRAGVAESSIFYHFGDKHELLQAVVRAQTPELAELRSTGGSLREGLIALCTTLEEHYARSLPVLTAVQADGELRRRMAEGGRQYCQAPLSALDRITEHLSAEIEAGRLRPGLDSRTAALLLLGASYQRALHVYMGCPAEVLPTVSDLVDALLPEPGHA